MDLRSEFLSPENIKNISKIFQLDQKQMLKIMEPYCIETILKKAQNCLPVLNHMFIQSLSNQDYDSLGYNICNKIDQQDINYQSMMPQNPYLITNRDKNMQQWADMTKLRQPQKIGKHSGNFIRTNTQYFTDMKQSETENIQYTNYTQNYYKMPILNNSLDSQYQQQLYLPIDYNVPYSYIDSKNLY